MPLTVLSVEMPLSEARAGDPAAWEVLFREFQLPLYTFVVEMIRNRESALDIVQETFINAVKHIGSLRDDAKFGSWLFRIAHQKCLQRLRRAGREEPLPDSGADAAAADLPDPSEWLVRVERIEALRRKLQELPEHHRCVLLLHVLGECPLEEIAAIVGVPVGTVKSRLYHARNALRALLEEDDL